MKKKKAFEISSVVVEIINNINKIKLNKTTEELNIEKKQNIEDILQYPNIKTIKELIKKKGYNEDLIDEIQNSLDYHLKLNNLFVYIKQEFIDKNKKFSLSDFEKYNGNNIITAFQPIVGDDKKIKKYEALMRYENNNKTKLDLKETLEFLTVFPNINPSEYKYQFTLSKMLKEIGIDKKLLNSIMTDLSNDLFKKNIVDSKTEYTKLVNYNKHNNNSKINNNNNPYTIITINIGKSQLLQEDMFKDLNNDEMDFISKNIQFELLEYRIKELDNPEKNKTTKQKNLLNNCDKIKKIGCKINLDDYLDIDFFYKRIKIFKKIFNNRFDSIKVDANITKKIDLYLKLQNCSDIEFINILPNYINEDFFIENYKYKELEQYFGIKNNNNFEILKKIDKKELINFFNNNDIDMKDKLKVYNLLLKNKLKNKGIKGVVEVIKLNIINSFKLSENTLKEIDDIFSQFFHNNNIENLLEKLNDIKTNNNIIMQNNNSRKNIIYEYIENGELVKFLNSVNQIFNKFTTSSKPISFQGYHYSKALSTEDLNNNNKITKNLNILNRSKDYIVS